MPSDQNQLVNQSDGDLQIKSTGQASAAQQTAVTGSQQGTSATAITPPVVQAPINLDEAPAATPVQPVNKRAFNLDEGVEDSSSGPAKPEKFAIPKLVKEKYPELVELVKTTESMDDQERQYWFQIMPIMSADQVDKFRNILLTEKQQLADLDKEYEDELNRLNEKHLLEWKEFESKEKTRAIKEAEAKSDVEEKQQEEDLLAKLSDV